MPSTDEAVHLPHSPAMLTEWSPELTELAEQLDCCFRNKWRRSDRGRGAMALAPDLRNFNFRVTTGSFKLQSESASSNS